MQRTDFYFDLPASLIAQMPSKERGDDRLLILDKKTGAFRDDLFSSIPDLLPKNALLVFNNSKVRRARVYGKALKKNSSTEIEFLFVKTLDSGVTWQVLSPKMRQLKAGDGILFGDCQATICEDEKYQKLLKFDKPLSEDFFEKLGHVPLPPYIKRKDIKEDTFRYQTVYASNVGSIACPTAGLHFTTEIVQKIRERGIETAYITLHVGLGTFLPVREENIEDHKMHREDFFISDEVATKITLAKREERPVIACGTTSVRTLEAAWNKERMCIEAGYKSTNIFIYPPYKFSVVDALITNFHTPESTLLMLVSAFCGRQNILRAYKHAIDESYKFFSYGDAMLIM